MRHPDGQRPGDSDSQRADAPGRIAPARAGILLASLLMLFVLAAPAGAAPGASAPSAADVAAGEKLYWGSDRFDGGAVACAACHTFTGAEALGGGRLGPSLDTIATTWTPQITSAWLKAPPSPTMTPIFGPKSGGELTQSERDLIGAYLADAGKDITAKEAAASAKASKSPSVDGSFLGIGIAVTIVFLLIMAALGGRRLRSVRAKLVSDSRI